MRHQFSPPAGRCERAMLFCLRYIVRLGKNRTSPDAAPKTSSQSRLAPDLTGRHNQIRVSLAAPTLFWKKRFEHASACCLPIVEIATSLLIAIFTPEKRCAQSRQYCTRYRSTTSWPPFLCRCPHDE